MKRYVVEYFDGEYDKQILIFVKDTLEVKQLSRFDIEIKADHVQFVIFGEKINFVVETK